MQLFANNANSTLAAGIAPGATAVTVNAGDGAKFPNPQAGQFFLVTLYQRIGITEMNWEIVMCTARSGDTLTIVRSQEGTTAMTFNQGDFIEIRLTAGAVLPVNAGALTSSLNEAQPVTLPSAVGVAIGAAGANSITITGNAVINGFDAIAPGATRRTTFTGNATLTYNATSMQLVTGASIVTAPGDWAEWISLGGGNWQMISYDRASGAPVLTLTAAAVQAALGFSPLPSSYAPAWASITGPVPTWNQNTTGNAATATTLQPNAVLTTPTLAASPALTDNSLAVASTAFVKGAIAASSTAWTYINSAIVAAAPGGVYTAVPGAAYDIDTSSGPVTLTLPAGMTANQTVAWRDYAGTFPVTNAVINNNGYKINGVASALFSDIAYETRQLTYTDNTVGLLLA